jgi:hypothetical protein
MKDRTYNGFRAIKDASFGDQVKSRRADGGRIHVVVTGNPDAWDEATGEGQHAVRPQSGWSEGIRKGIRVHRSLRKTDGKNIASGSG